MALNLIRVDDSNIKSIETALRPRPVKELLNEVRKMKTSSNEQTKFVEEHKTKLDSNCDDITLRTGEWKHLKMNFKNTKKKENLKKIDNYDV